MGPTFFKCQNGCGSDVVANVQIKRAANTGGTQPTDVQHAKLAIALMDKMESLSKTTTRLWDDHQLLNDIIDEWRSATGKR